MMYELYYAPGTGSMAAHILLQHTGSPFVRHVVQLTSGEQFSARHQLLHPLSRIPVLIANDGEVVRENAAVCLKIALDHPQLDLWPRDGAAAVATQTWVSWVVSEAHPAFRTFYRPERVVAQADESLRESIRLAGRQAFERVLQAMVNSLSEPLAPPCDRMTAAGALVYVKLHWGARMKLPVVHSEAAKHWLTNFERLPAVKKTLAEEGLHSAVEVT